MAVLARSDAAPGRAADRARASALRTIACERDGLEALRQAMATDPLGDAFERAARLLVMASGRVVVTGMGKSGLAGRKLAALLASTGTPALFLHPAEAGHGDLGMVVAGDVVLALSWSGRTRELSDVVHYCRLRDIPLIAVTAGHDSELARQASITLPLPSVREACPHQLAPTSSTIVQAALGDALALALFEERGFQPTDFHKFHPRGRLGAQLVTVEQLMSRGAEVPQVPADASIAAALREISRKRFGATAVVDAAGGLLGVFTDGDLRRSFAVAGPDAPVRVFMCDHPQTIAPDQLAADALVRMNERSIMQLFVCRDDAKLVGIIHMHDVLRAGLL